MKSILVPTDFSKCAGYALDVAFQFAEKFGSRIHLLTHLKLPENWKELTPAEQRKQSATFIKTERVEARFHRLLKKYKDFDLITSYAGGNLAKTIDTYVEKHGIELIIMGSHGVSGKNEFFIGSNTQRVIRSVHCPVLVIKNSVPSINFDSVLYASGFNENEQESFLRFKEFVKPFLPEIHLVAIHTNSLFDPPYIISQLAMEDYKKLCSPFHCKTHIYKDLNIDKGIRGIAEDIGVNLIGISNHFRHPLKRMLVGSNVEALVNHADVPVLSIDYIGIEEFSAGSQQ